MKKTTNFRADIEFDTFWHHFLLNEIVCFVQNNVVSSTVHIKNKIKKQCHFEHHYVSYSSLGRVEAGEEEEFSPGTPLSVSLLETQKNDTYRLPTRENKGDKPASGAVVAAQCPACHPTHSTRLDKVGWLSPPFPLINTRVLRGD